MLENKLTIKQKMLLEAIEWFINEYGYSPTNRELANILKCDVNTVFKKLLILEEKGYIKTQNGRARTIQIIKEVEE
jgi:SOS-response transcriptional repressor LexA|nr:MAG TPA: SOS regulatory protein LexA [Bacteriophage sp.]